MKASIAEKTMHPEKISNIIPTNSINEYSLSELNAFNNMKSP